jgi:CRP-like cAMP-binding protein
MSLARDMELLRQVPLLSEFPDEQLRLLAFSAENVSYRDGEVLFSSGERADAGLVVASGAITLESDDGSVKPVTFGPGSLIGETALLVETRRPARAVASGASEVIRIRRALFKRMLQEFPDIARRLFDARAAEFRATVGALSRVGNVLEQIDRESAELRANLRRKTPED